MCFLIVATHRLRTVGLDNLMFLWHFFSPGRHGSDIRKLECSPEPHLVPHGKGGTKQQLAESIHLRTVWWYFLQPKEFSWKATWKPTGRTEGKWLYCCDSAIRGSSAWWGSAFASRGRKNSTPPNDLSQRCTCQTLFETTKRPVVCVPQLFFPAVGLYEINRKRTQLGEKK